MVAREERSALGFRCLSPRFASSALANADVADEFVKTGWKAPSAEVQHKAKSIVLLGTEPDSFRQEMMADPFRQFSACSAPWVPRGP